MDELPHNLSAEAALIGSVLFDNARFYDVRDTVTPEAFYAPSHQEMWMLISDRIVSGSVADGVTLREHFETRLNEIGGAEYLQHLYDSAAFGPEVRDYATIVSDCHLRRQLMIAGQQLVRAAETEDGSIALEAHETELEAVRDARPNRIRIQSVADIADWSVQQDDTFSLLKSGLPTIDKELRGFERGALSVIAARPGVGKSALAVCMMAYMAREESVGFISIDMNGRVVNQRLGCFMAWSQGHHVPFVSELRDGVATAAQRQLIADAMKSTAGQRCFVDHRGHLSTGDINLQIREWKRHLKRAGLPQLGAVFVDHIGKVYPKQRTGSIYEKTSYASNELLEVAKQHENLATISLAQLNRETAKGKRRPTIADLRDSGKIEEDASAVILLHREDLYLALDAKNEALDEDERARAQREMLKYKGVFEVIIGKNRNGEPGAVTLSHSIGHNVIRDPILMSQRRAA
jgi:replicative DNA helicase